MPKEIGFSNQNRVVTESILTMLLQSVAKQEQDEEIIQLRKEIAQLKTAVLIQQEACSQQDQWLANVQSQNTFLHNKLKVVIEEREMLNAELSLVIGFLSKLRSWLKTITFAIHFPSQTADCRPIDKLLLDKTLIPRLLAVTSPAQLSAADSVGLLKELQEADQTLKNQVRIQYPDKVWLVLSKLLYPPHAIKEFQVFETFCDDFWPKEKSIFPANTEISDRLIRVMQSTQLMLLAPQNKTNTEFIAAILEHLARRFKIVPITLEAVNAQLKTAPPRHFCRVQNSSGSLVL
ncbi:MAG: hypothetical protein WBE18_00220, partial [Gammaproteobacteria bacterium]